MGALQRCTGGPVQSGAARALAANDLHAGRLASIRPRLMPSAYLELDKPSCSQGAVSLGCNDHLAGQLCTPARPVGKPASPQAIAHALGLSKGFCIEAASRQCLKNTRHFNEAVKAI